jgi:hypothetical protein
MELRVTPYWAASFAVNFSKELFRHWFDGLNKVFAKKKPTLDEGRASTNPLVGKWIVFGIQGEGDLSCNASSPFRSESLTPSRKSSNAACLNTLAFNLGNVTWPKLL